MGLVPRHSLGCSLMGTRGFFCLHGRGNTSKKIRCVTSAWQKSLVNKYSKPCKDEVIVQLSRKIQFVEFLRFIFPEFFSASSQEQWLTTRSFFYRTEDFQISPNPASKNSLVYIAAAFCRSLSSYGAVHRH